MRLTATRLRSIVSRAVVVCAILAGGCASAPSVAPLLRITEQALNREAARLEEDALRDAQHIRQTLRSLEDAFHQDLDQAELLTTDWVREAIGVYVAARETMLRHEHTLAAERRTRADNLQAAASATRRAIQLIEQQDRLLDGVVGEEFRRLLTYQAFRSEESAR